MHKFWRSRKAVSDMIGGIIVLALLLTALVSMVVVTQQYDTYQNIASIMSQKDVDRISENVTAIYPGLSANYTVNGCGSKCTAYKMTLANVGGIGVQIARIYINSTQPSSGCTIAAGACVINPTNMTTPTPYAFNMKEAFLNVGEMNHTVHLWLPQAIVLPNKQYKPANTISIVTSRGRVFTFQWPFPPVGEAGGQGANPTIQTGTMKIAYNGGGYYSSSEGSGGSTYCHSAGEKETWSGPGGGTLTFVNPWITYKILQSVVSGNLWVSVHTINSLNYSVTINWGNINLQVANSSSDSMQYYIGGPLAGVVYPITPAPGTFTAAGTPVTIPPDYEFIMIFQILRSDIPSGGGLSFSGTATVDNANPPTTTTVSGDSNGPNGTGFLALSIYCDGLYVRDKC